MVTINKALKKLPFSVKLIILAAAPLVFLVYIGTNLYVERNEKIAIIKVNLTRINQSSDIAYLIDHLQEERKYSFDYAMTEASHNLVLQQRPQTDLYFTRLVKSADPALDSFETYTGLDRLAEVRASIDIAAMTPELVMHYYSNTIFRLNTLNNLAAPVDPYLAPVYKDLVAQKLLSEMITYLGIIRSNIYNVLYSRKYMVETLIGTIGTYDVYKSYEKEFLIKATPGIAKEYISIRDNSALQPTRSYIDTLFKKFSFDSTHTARTWWAVSDQGVNELRAFQHRIWQNVQLELSEIYNKERFAQRRGVLLLLAMLVLVIGMVAYIIFLITQRLKELRTAARKISKGITGLNIDASSTDIIGDLAKCMAEIDKTNKKLADSAEAIGKGDFNVSVEARSPQDVLGNSILTMQEELRQYRGEMEALVAQRTLELSRSNDDLQQFAHVVSHDLKEPVRKVSIFGGRLLQEQEHLSDKGKLHLKKIQEAVQRMSRMIDDILDHSIVNAGGLPFESVDLNKVIDAIKDDLELMLLQKGATIKRDILPGVRGVPVLIHQLFYNLIINAIKFSKVGVSPTIVIRSGVASHHELDQVKKQNTELRYAKIEVVDNGIGFDQSYAEKIFTAFTRLNSHHTYGGTGLGLSICKKVIQRHNGHIYAESEVGCGTIIHVLLPVDC